MTDRLSLVLTVCAVIALAVFVITALFVAVVDAIAERYKRGWGESGEYARRFDPSTVCRISGRVVMVERFAPRHALSRGVHLLLRSASGNLLVALGPAWYVDAQETSFKSGDWVEVVGSMIEYRGKPVLVAAEVTKGRRTLILRDANGRPAWVGDAARRHRGAATPLYQSDLDRHLWSRKGLKSG